METSHSLALPAELHLVLPFPAGVLCTKPAPSGVFVGGRFLCQGSLSAIRHHINWGTGSKLTNLVHVEQKLLGLSSDSLPLTAVLAFGKSTVRLRSVLRQAITTGRNVDFD